MPSPELERRGSGPWRARAFGLEIESDVDVPGLNPAWGAAQGPSLELRMASPQAIDAGWPATGSQRVLEERFEPPPAPPARTIDVHEEAGYRLYARHFGLAHITPSGDIVTCAPPDEAELWSWQRFLVGRVLPWAAVLRGYEPFHASAVAIDRRAVAFIGSTGGGKTSLALRLVAGGAGFITDDVLAVDAPEGHPRVHPGACVAAVRSAEREVIPEAVWERLGEVLGVSGKTYLNMEIEPNPLPLGAIYFLAARAGALIEPIEQLDPRLLLASTFVIGVQSARRLRDQLDICARIAREVPVFSLRISGQLDAGQVAEAVRDHLEQAVTA
jgi:hypothetical protein